MRDDGAALVAMMWQARALPWARCSRRAAGSRRGRERRSWQVCCVGPRKSHIALSK